MRVASTGAASVTIGTTGDVSSVDARAGKGGVTVLVQGKVDTGGIIAWTDSVTDTTTTR